MCHHFGSLYEEDDTPTSDPELDFGACYSLPTYWIGQTLMHSWAGRVLRHDLLAQAVSWATDHNVSSPALQYLRGPISPSGFSAEDDSIAMALLTDLPGCVELLQQAQDLAARMVLKCIRFTFAKEFGVINLAQASIAIYVVLQYFKRRRKAEELLVCAKAVAVFETRGLVLGELFKIDSEYWKSILEGDRIPQ